jgi:hypothetical protein
MPAACCRSVTSGLISLYRDNFAQQEYGYSIPPRGKRVLPHFELIRNMGLWIQADRAAASRILTRYILNVIGEPGGGVPLSLR